MNIFYSFIGCFSLEHPFYILELCIWRNNLSEEAEKSQIVLRFSFRNFDPVEVFKQVRVWVSLNSDLDVFKNTVLQKSSSCRQK